MRSRICAIKRKGSRALPDLKDVNRLYGPYDLAGLKAVGAYPDALRGSVDYRLYVLEVGEPSTLGVPHGIAYFMARYGAFIAYLAYLRHYYSPSGSRPKVQLL